MEHKYCFEYLEGYNLKPGDKICEPCSCNDEVGVVFIYRKDESSISGMYSKETGKLILANNEYDEVKLVRDKAPVSGKFYAGERFFAVLKDGKVGAYSLFGEPLLPIEFKDIMHFRNGVFIVQTMNGKYAAYTDDGNKILHKEYSEIDWDFVGKWFYFAHEKGGVTVFSSEGKVIIENIRRSSIIVHYWFLMYRNKNSFELYTTNGLVGKFDGCPRHMSQGYIEVKLRAGQRYVINAVDGSVVIPPNEYKSIKKRGRSIIAETSQGKCTAVVIEEKTC